MSSPRTPPIRCGRCGRRVGWRDRGWAHSGTTPRGWVGCAGAVPQDDWERVHAAWMSELRLSICLFRAEQLAANPDAPAWSDDAELKASPEWAQAEAIRGARSAKIER